MLIKLRSLEDSDKEIAAPAPKIVPKKPANKWQGEDEEEDGPVVSFVFHYSQIFCAKLGFCRVIGRNHLKVKMKSPYLLRLLLPRRRGL